MIGQKFSNRYDIREHLGDGSTATVYRAFDTKLGRDVALKVLLPHVRDTTRKRFFQEATAAAQLNHANIMAIYDVDQHDERDFLVVEYVQGEPLSHYIPSSVETVLNLGTQIALALDYAHEREIIHRDIKPANIKVTPEGLIKIMDLGLALPREAKRVTAHGMVIGTPAYLSPEQAQGQPLDRRTDIYSLGIVLFEMLTGQLPFNADDITALLLQQVRQPPPPPRLIVPEIPVELENIIIKTLEKDPNRRYQTARALAEAMRSLREGGESEKPTLSRRPEWADELKDAAASKEGGPVRAPAVAPPRAKRTIRVVLADDHSLLRSTLANFLESREDFVVLGQAEDGNQALTLATTLLPDVLILDLNMPVRGGLEVLPDVRKQAPEVRVIVLTGRDDDAYIMRALRSGAHGYLLKSTDEEELVQGIYRVMDGDVVLGRGVTEKVVGGLLNRNADEEEETSVPDDLERRILLFVAAGYDNEQISRRLGLGQSMIIESIARVMGKLHAKDRNTAALAAIRRGHIMLEDVQEIEPPPA